MDPYRPIKDPPTENQNRLVTDNEQTNGNYNGPFLMDYLKDPLPDHLPDQMTTQMTLQNNLQMIHIQTIQQAS